MSLKVYFGNNLIDEEYYTELTNSYELFNDSFRLGTTPSNIYKLSIAKEGVSSQPSNVILKENNTTFAELEIDNIEEQDYTYSYDLTDKMLDLEFYYDASEIFVNGKTTLLAIAQDICSKAGLTLGTTNFRGYNKEISWYDNRRTAREYIGFIAELNGGFARVENSTLYFRKQKTSSVKTIDIDDCENFIIGEYHKITRVVYELGALKYEFGNETGNTLYLNSDNVFITEESEVQAIYNDIKDFEFYSFETGNCPIDYSVKAGDIITFTDGTNNYPTIAQYELEYFGTWIGGYSLSVNTERQEETKVVGNTEKIKNLQVIVDRDANTITQLVETTEEIEHQFETLQDIDGFAEGKYIYLDDASDELITSAKFNGETSQEGTPSPDYPSEIINLEGKNYFNANAITNSYITVSSDGKEITMPVATSGNGGMGAGVKLNVLCPDLKVGDTVYIYAERNGTENKFIYLNGSSYLWKWGTTRTITANDLNGNVTLYGNRYQDGETQQIIISNMRILKEKYSDFAPYNNLGIKVTNKNLVDNIALGKYNTSTGALTTATDIYCNLTLIKIDNTKDIYISQNGNPLYVRAFWYDKTGAFLGTNLSNSSTGKFTILENSECMTFQVADSTINNSTEGIQLEYNSISNAVEHQEQIVYFPLAEGQKLYEGSYLADDGIHNIRGQVVLNGSESWNYYAAYHNNGGVGYCYSINLATLNIDCEIGFNKSICSHFTNVEGAYTAGIGYVGAYTDHPSLKYKYFISDKTTSEELKTWLSNNPITVEYELAEEETIPYNTEQQAAWNNIKSLHTYKTVTHIYSDAYAEIGYIKDNMLSDFETKASAQLTKNDVSQLKIENGRISSEVSSTQSQFNNYYTKNEADNNTNSTKAELQNIIQQNKTEIEQTTQALNLRVSSIETNGVDKIETSMGYTFNNEGLNIDKDGAATASTIDNEAFKVKNKSANENVFFAGYVSGQSSAYRGQTIVESTNLVVKNYLNIEGASRFQPYVNPVLGGHGTGAFDIG